MEKAEKKQSVVRSAAAMSLGTLSSRILGMLRDMVLAAFFSRTATDAYLVAFRLPNMFRRLLGEGALSVSFLPIYIEQLVPKEGESKEEAQERAKRLSSGIFTLLCWVSSLLTGLGIIFMRPLLETLVSGEGYNNIPGKIEQTVFLGRIMFGYLFLVTQYAFLMSIMNAFKKFLVPALGPAFFNLTFIVFALLPKEWGRIEGETLAWGVLVGGFVQAGFVFVPLYRMGFLPRFRWQWRVQGVSTVLKNMVPGLIGMGILQLMGLANIYFASLLSEGTHTYIYLADRILELPQSIVAISLGAALLPTLSELWSHGKKEDMLKVSQKHMRLLLFLAMPSAVGMFVLAKPMVEVLFMRGKFLPEHAEVTAQIVQVYSFLLVCVGLHKVTVPSFYAIKNTWLPACTSLAAFLFHLILAPLLMDQYGLRGLIGSMTVAALLNLGILLVAYRKFIGPVGLVKLLSSGLHNVPALVAMGAIVSLFYGAALPIFQSLMGAAVGRAIDLIVSIVVGILVYFTVSFVVKQEIAQDALGILQKKLLKRRA